MSNNDNTNNMQATQVGSLTRITIGAPVATSGAPQAQPQEPHTVARGVTRFNMAPGGEATNTGVTRYNSGQEVHTSVMATLQRDRNGPSVEIEPGNPASRTLLSTAVRAGLVEPSGAAGEYRDRGSRSDGSAENSEAAPAADLEATQADPGKGVFDPQDDSDWDSLIEPLPQHSYDQASASVTLAVLSGADSLDSAAQQLAKSAGLSPVEANFIVREGHDMYERIVAKEAAAVGVQDKKAFYDWMRDTKPRALQEAIQSLTAGRDASKFGVMALEFNRYNSAQAQDQRRRDR